MKKEYKFRVRISGKDVETIESIKKILKKFGKKQVSLSQAIGFILKTMETNYRSNDCNKIIKKLIMVTSKIDQEKRFSRNRKE
jgi:hypothetical protein